MVRETDFLTVGRVASAHSLKGELFVRLAAGHADWLDSVSELRLVRGFEVKSLVIAAARPHKDGLILKPEGVSDRTAAEAFKGFTVQIPAHVLSAPVGEKPYLFELLDFKV